MKEVSQKNGLEFLLTEEPEEVKHLLGSLTEIARDGFGLDDIETNEKSVYQHAILNQRFLVLVRDGNKYVGFAAFSEIDDLLFLTGIVVKKDYQNHGIGSEVFRLMKEFNGHKYFAFTTQNPVMRILMEKICSSVFPSRNGKVIPKTVKKLASEIMKQRKGEFDPLTFVSHGLYTSPLYDSIPESRDEEINEFFIERLKIKEGKSLHGMLCIGTL